MRPDGLRAALLAAAVGTLALALATPAGAANRRVAIGDYRWSMPQVTIDLGEHVTWHFIGPDLSHSVTGTSANATGLDSDPQTNLPQHRLGDTYRLTFDQPGTYSFQCKLHTAVAGSVTVTSQPGDPDAEPDPVPASRADLRRPTLGGVRLAPRRFARKGGRLHVALDERSRLEAEYYRLSGDGRRRFSGYEVWRAHVGFNYLRFGAPGDHFRARPGRYMALLSAIDTSANRSRFERLRFTIVGRGRG